MDFILDTASTNEILSQNKINIHVQPLVCLNSIPPGNKKKQEIAILW